MLTNQRFLDRYLYGLMKLPEFIPTDDWKRITMTVDDPYSRLLKLLTCYIQTEFYSSSPAYRMVCEMALNPVAMPLDEHVRARQLTVSDVFDMGWTLACIKIMHRLREAMINERTD